MDVDMMTAADPGESKAEGFRTGYSFCKADIFGTGRESLEQPTSSALCHRHMSLWLHRSLGLQLLALRWFSHAPNALLSGARDTACIPTLLRANHSC